MNKNVCDTLQIILGQIFPYLTHQSYYYESVSAIVI